MTSVVDSAGVSSSLAEVELVSGEPGEPDANIPFPVDTGYASPSPAEVD